MLDNQLHNLEPDLNKLDPRSRAAIAFGQLGERMECLIRAGRPLQAAQREQLQNLGVTIRCEIGEIVSAEFPSAKLKEVLTLPFVDYVEGASPLFAEGKAPGRH